MSEQERHGSAHITAQPQEVRGRGAGAGGMFDSIRKLIFGRRPRETAVDRSTSVDPRRFEARVRDVADIASAITRTAADVHRNTDLPDWELALSLVDREPQVEKLSERLDAFVKEGPGR